MFFLDSVAALSLALLLLRVNDTQRVFFFIAIFLQGLLGNVGKLNKWNIIRIFVFGGSG